MAQECNGNLGENIFEEGDFGEGTANIVQNDPNIAPGYTYTTIMPPNDGFYTITDDLCDGTLYEFSADIFNLLNPGANNIKPNVSFAIDGVVQYSTGEVAENNQWQTFGFTFETAPGQTSVTLSLLNNAPGGQGNDLALDNITFRACGDEALILPDEIANICEDGSNILLDATVIGTIYADPAYQWQQSFDGGMTWVDIAGANGLSIEHTDLTAGIYYYRYLLADGASNLASEKCRVQSNIKIINDLTIVPDPDIQVSITTTLPGCSNTLDGSIEINNIFNGAEPYTVSVDGVELTAGTDLFNVPVGDFINIDIASTQEIVSYFWAPDNYVDCEADCDGLDFAPPYSTT